MIEDERIVRLPVWAREMVRDLRLRLDAQSDPLIRELKKLRPLVEVLQARNAALTELLSCAARGGHKTAAEIVEVIRDCDLVLAPREESLHPEGV